MSKLKKTKLHIKGMHCPACEVLITDKFKEVGNIQSVQANFRKLEAQIEHRGQLNINELNERIQEFGYQVVTDQPVREVQDPFLSRLMDVAIIAMVVLFLYFVASRFNLIPSIGGANGLTILTALMLGFVASVSTCMATSGALFLSTIGTLGNETGTNSGVTGKLIPAVSFGIGRIISYALVGFIAGYIGKVLTFNLQLGLVLTLAVSLFMILVGLDMTKLVSLEKYISATFTKGLFEKLTALFKKNPRQTALILGALTVLLPCGFTQTVFVYAVGLSDPVQSALMMAAFAVGTVPVFIVLGFVNSFTKSSWYPMLQKVMGVVILFIGIAYVLNFLSLIGLQLPNIGAKPSVVEKMNPVTEENGVQIVRMTVNARGYFPNTFTLKKGVPVRWIINGEDVYGCQASLIAPKAGVQKVLEPGENIIEFTPSESGVLPFSCSMGMYRGQFRVE